MNELEVLLLVNVFNQNTNKTQANLIIQGKGQMVPKERKDQKTKPYYLENKDSLPSNNKQNTSYSNNKQNIHRVALTSTASVLK